MQLKMNSDSVAECFAVAEKKLLDAMDRQRSKGMDGQGNNDAIVETTGSKTTLVAPNNGPEESLDDPDDMAAAFFAMQAKKKRDEERQNQKILDDWATIILQREKGCQTESSTIEQQVSKMPSTQAKPSASLAEELLLDFGLS